MNKKLFKVIGLVVSLALLIACGQGGIADPSGVVGGGSGYGNNSFQNGDEIVPQGEALSLLGSWKHDYDDGCYDIYNFLEDGVFSGEYFYEYYNDYFIYHGTYSVNGNELIISFESNTVYFTFLLNNDTLTINNEDESYVFYRID